MKILVVYNHDRSFVHKDINMLSKHNDVTSLFYTHEKSKIKDAVKKSDVVLSWFASKHSLKTFRYAKKYGKKTMVIVGGYDASDIKGYGMFSSYLKRKIVTYIYENTDVILPVDDSLEKVIIKYLPDVKNKIQVVPTGYDSTYFKPKGEKKKQVLTVCYVDEINWWRKGIFTLVDVAKKMPDIQFFVAGKISDKIKKKVDFTPKNVTFTGWLSDNELLQFYQETKVFALLSKYEGLPNVLCEAMLCGCIPVGTNVCGIPKAIGNADFITEYNNTEDAFKKIRMAINSPEKLGLEGREHIKKNFSVDKRERIVNKILEEIS